MPNFDSLDIISSQGLYLNVLNVISLVFLGYKFTLKKITSKDLLKCFNNYVYVGFFLFFIWSSISISWSINQSEAIRTVTEYITTFIVLINIILHVFLLKTDRVKIVLNALIVMQVIELYFLTEKYFSDVLLGVYRPGSMAYNGVTGNKNIAAFSILIKIPILTYFLLQNYVNKQYFKLLFHSILFILSSLSIFFITQTRAAELGFILLIGFLFSIIFTFKDLKAKKFRFLFYMLSLLAVTYISGQATTLGKTNITNNINSAFTSLDSSTNERIRFYSYALELIKNNFFTGTGIGSWELESIEKDRLEMKSYVVPYHTHNDFLEIFSETGLIGFVTFYLPILFLYFILFLRILKNKLYPFLDVTVFLMLSMYLLDAMFNFPFARVIQNINLIFIILLSLQLIDDLKVYKPLKGSFAKAFIRFSLFVIILISPLILYSSIRLFQSAQDQSKLLYAFNQNNFKLFTDEDLKKIERHYPNLTGTALPISSIIGIHYYYYNDLDEAEKYLREGIKANPYLNVGQTYLGRVFEKKGKLDSALYYTKYAFNKMPNNPVHFAHYVMVLSRKNDTIGIKKAYDKVIYKDRDERFEKMYLLAMSNLLDKDEGRMVLNEIKKEQLKSDGLKGSYFILELGKDRVKQGYIDYLKAESYFKNGDFRNAAQFYAKAFSQNPLEYPYAENAAISFLRTKNIEKAEEYINYVLDNLDESIKNGKAFYIKGLIYLERNMTSEACEFFQNALDRNFDSNVALNSYCR
ncbi:MAG: O-antigen ligase family protein [Jejuia sp.]